MADSSRITEHDVAQEISRLKQRWQPAAQQQTHAYLALYLTQNHINQLDLFDAQQLDYVLSICQQHGSMASAGRALFNVSRTQKVQVNDSTRLQKYLAKFDLKWRDLK